MILQAFEQMWMISSSRVQSITATKFTSINLNEDKRLSGVIKPAQAFSVLPHKAKHSCKSVVFIQSLRNSIEHPS